MAVGHRRIPWNDRRVIEEELAKAHRVERADGEW